MNIPDNILLTQLTVGQFRKLRGESDIPGYITLQQLVDKLPVSENTVRKLLKDNEVVLHKIGGQNCYLIEDAKRIIKKVK